MGKENWLCADSVSSAGVVLRWVLSAGSGSGEGWIPILCGDLGSTDISLSSSPWMAPLRRLTNSLLQSTYIIKDRMKTGNTTEGTIILI